MGVVVVKAVGVVNPVNLCPSSRGVSVEVWTTPPGNVTSFGLMVVVEPSFGLKRFRNLKVVEAGVVVVGCKRDRD